MANELTAEELASLRSIAGIKAKIPDAHRQKLVKLGFAEAQGEATAATPQGRNYLRSQRKPGG
jgi:hypothetical protein